MWDLWDQLACPTLVLRGSVSDMLPASAAREMTRRGPRAELVEFRAIGHLPALLDAGQIAPIAELLERGRA